MYLFSSVVVLIIISYISMHIVKETFQLELTFRTDPFFAGQKRKFTLSADSLMPMPYLAVRGENDIADFRKDSTSTISFEDKLWIEKDVYFPKRGIYNPGLFYVEGSDIFNIFKISGRIDLDRKIKVYPADYKVKKIYTGGKDIFQEMYNLNSTIENPYQIKDFRKYQAGDSLKKVHWKLSAKYSELYSRNNENRTGQGFSIIADMNRSNYDFDATGETEELLIDGMVSLLYRLFDTSISIKIILNKKNLQHHEINSQSSFKDFIEHLITARSDGHESFTQFLNKKIKAIEKINHIAVIAVSINSGLAIKLAELASKGYCLSFFYCIENDDLKAEMARLKKVKVNAYNFKDILEFDGKANEII